MQTSAFADTSSSRPKLAKGCVEEPEESDEIIKYDNNPPDEAPQSNPNRDAPPADAPTADAAMEDMPEPMCWTTISFRHAPRHTVPLIHPGFSNNSVVPPATSTLKRPPSDWEHDHKQR
jgi:hypothetical protein